MVDLPRLQKVFGKPELAWILKNVRRRLERGEQLTGSLHQKNSSPEQRDVLQRLLNKKFANADVSVRIVDLENMLIDGEFGVDLAQAAAALLGPIHNLRAAELQRSNAWQSLFICYAKLVVEKNLALNFVEGRTASEGLNPLLLWLNDLQAGEKRSLRSIAEERIDVAKGLLDSCLRVLAKLPATGLTVAELAATCTGNSHALDNDEQLSKLMLRAIAKIKQTEWLDGTEGRRDAWASVGVLCDELSAPLLVLNLRAEGNSVTANALNLHADVGEPYRLSVRQLLRTPPAFSKIATGDVVYVCENPAIVASAADRYGHRTRGMICLEGQPKTAAYVALKLLVEAGVRLAYHGDFDWPGIQIANFVIKRFAALPWRFDALAYCRAVENGDHPLKGSAIQPTWDDQLGKVMQEKGIAIHEEQLIDQLLPDIVF